MLFCLILFLHAYLKSSPMLHTDWLLFTFRKTTIQWGKVFHFIFWCLTDFIYISILQISMPQFLYLIKSVAFDFRSLWDERTQGILLDVSILTRGAYKLWREKGFRMKTLVLGRQSHDFDNEWPASLQTATAFWDTLVAMVHEGCILNHLHLNHLCYISSPILNASWIQLSFYLLLFLKHIHVHSFSHLMTVYQISFPPFQRITSNMY